MEFKIKFNLGDKVFIYRDGDVRKVTIVGFEIKALLPVEIPNIEYRILPWDVLVSEDELFTTKEEAYQALEDYLKALD